MKPILDVSLLNLDKANPKIKDKKEKSTKKKKVLFLQNFF